jgi:Ubiquitin family
MSAHFKTIMILLGRDQQSTVSDVYVEMLILTKQQLQPTVGRVSPTTFVYIVTLTGKTIQLPVNVDETIDNVKARIQDEEGIPPGEKNSKFRKRMLMLINSSNRSTMSDFRWEAAGGWANI